MPARPIELRDWLIQVFLHFPVTFLILWPAGWWATPGSVGIWYYHEVTQARASGEGWREALLPFGRRRLFDLTGHLAAGLAITAWSLFRG